MEIGGCNRERTRRSMTNLRTLAVIAFTASVLAALGGCANKQGDLGTDYRTTPEIRTTPDFQPVKPDHVAQNAKASDAAAEVIDIAAVKPAALGETVELASSKDQAVAELVSLK